MVLQRFSGGAPGSKRPLVHVAMAGIRAHSLVQKLVPVVPEPQVVSQFVREDATAAVVDAEAEGAAEKGYAPHVRLADQQVREVRAGAVAHDVDAVHLAVRRVREARQVVAALARLDVVHLVSGHQRDAKAHPARVVGLVSLGDHEIDHRFDRVGSARRFPRGRRVEDGRVDRARIRPAHGAAEVNRVQPRHPGGGRARPAAEDVEPVEVATGFRPAGNGPD